jgi:hypothetical protein
MQRRAAFFAARTTTLAFDVWNGLFYFSKLRHDSTYCLQYKVFDQSTVIGDRLFADLKRKQQTLIKLKGPPHLATRRPFFHLFNAV